MPVVDLREAVEKALAESGPEVMQSVIDELVGRERNERMKAVLALLSAREELEKKLLKIKPVPLGFDVDGKPTSIAFTPQQFEERKKIQKDLQKMDDMFSAAFDKSEWDGIKKFACGVPLDKTSKDEKS